MQSSQWKKKKQMPSTYRPFVLIARATANNGGCTFDASGSIVERDSGYVVSPYPEHGRTFLTSDRKSAIAAKTALFHNHVMNSEWTLPENHYFGTWLDGETLHLDIVVIVDDMTDAMRLAYEHNQLAVYDLANGCDITVERSYGYCVVPNRYGDIVLYRAYITYDGEVHYDMSNGSTYLQSESDKDGLQDCLSDSDCCDLARGFDVFVLDNAPNASLLSDYFGTDV